MSNKCVVLCLLMLFEMCEETDVYSICQKESTPETELKSLSWLYSCHAVQCCGGKMAGLGEEKPEPEPDAQQ
jgi:hypothetical protein